MSNSFANPIIYDIANDNFKVMKFMLFCLLYNQINITIHSSFKVSLSYIVMEIAVTFIVGLKSRYC